MALKKPTGDMYDFIDGIWNPVSGKCYHGCTYCYVKRTAKRYGHSQKEPHLNMSELNKNLGSNQLVFVCSGCDLFADDVPYEYIKAVIDRSLQFKDNKYLLQTKNPARIVYSSFGLSTEIHKICTTIETNRYIPGIMGNSPHPDLRATAMNVLANNGFETMVTIEPIMDFDLDKMLERIAITKATQVNIGADSDHKQNNLPEPLEEKVIELISELEKFTIVKKKKNLGRITNAIR
jgi:DNA repair photolyase